MRFQWKKTILKYCQDNYCKLVSLVFNLIYRVKDYSYFYFLPSALITSMAEIKLAVYVHFLLFEIKFWYLHDEDSKESCFFSWYSRFWHLVTSAPGFQSQGGSLFTCFLTCVILRFTSGMTPADCRDHHGSRAFLTHVLTNVSASIGGGLGWGSSPCLAQTQDRLCDEHSTEYHSATPALLKRKLAFNITNKIHGLLSCDRFQDFCSFGSLRQNTRVVRENTARFISFGSLYSLYGYSDPCN